MSYPFQHGYEHQAIPVDEEHFDEEDECLIDSHPFTGEHEAPPPPTSCSFASTHTGQSAAQMQNYDPAQDRTPQNQLLLDQPVQYTFEPWNPPQNPMEYTMSARILASYLGIPDVAAEDATHVAGTHQATVSPPERACAEQLARSGKFLQWLRSPGSSRLLVHTNYSGGPSPVSGLSLFCVSLREALLARPDRRFIPLVFFCGLHTELLGDDRTGALVDARSGAHGLMRSLIYQLLGRYHGREPVWLNETPQEIHAIQEGNLSALYGLFHRLVHRLPGDVAVCCLVDGAVYYERDEFLDDMENVMLPLLQLCGQGVTRAPFKLLVTSPASTIYVRRWFAEESILSMTELDRESLASDGSGLERELASAIQ